MKILCDENLPATLAAQLRAAGIDALDVRDCGLVGASDDEVLARSVEEERILLTMDVRRFGNLIATPPGTTPGLVVARLPELSTRVVCARLVSFLQTTDEIELAGALTIVEATTARRRR